LERQDFTYGVVTPHSDHAISATEQLAGLGYELEDPEPGSVGRYLEDALPHVGGEIGAADEQAVCVFREPGVDESLG
jgi:hypothetical protein